MAELMADGLPVLIRRQFDEHDEIVLRSYLDQPVILYGHTSDFAHGLEPLAAAAAVINSLPSVSWGSLAEITSSNFEWRRDGGALQIRPFARRLRLRVEPDVEEIRFLRLGPEHGAQVALEGRPGRFLDVEDGVVGLPSGRSGPVGVEIRWKPLRTVVPASVPPPAFAPHVVARRLLVEARDRLDPVVRRG